MRFLKILFLFLILTSLNCKKESIPVQTSSVPVKKTISYLALGDSYTIGQSVAVSERYPVILAESLSNSNLTVKDPKIIATTGWTTANLKNGIVNAGIDTNQYDIVSLLIGVNNYYQGRSITEYKKEFTELVQTSINFAHGNKDKVFVISIPDYGYTPFGQGNQAQISQGIDQFNAVNKAVVDSMGVQYFNITPISRNGLSDPALVAGDGLHPSGKQYAQWVDLMLQGVKQILEK
jgi:lysophospholipase L1-like esterase